MRKLDSLRAALVAANHQLGRDPDRLVVFVDKGRLVSRFGASLAYEWRYTVRLEFRDFTSSPDAIAVPLLLWLREHQPERLLEFAREDTALGFAADIIDDKTWDVAFAFELAEAVTLAPRDGGGWNVDHLPEPPIADLALASGLDAPALVGEIWLDDERLV